MNITKENLDNLEKKYPGFIKGEKVDEFFKEFGIKFAAGHWTAGDFKDRFATDGYNPSLPSDIFSQLERIKETNVKGVELHNTVFVDDETGKWDYKLINDIKDKMKELGLVPTNMNTNVWTHHRWKMGSIANPIREIREAALTRALETVDLAAEVGCASVALWPGSDGWDYNFEADYGKLFKWFLEGTLKIAERAKKHGLKFGIEAKPHEPREGNMIVATTHQGILFSKMVNERLGEPIMGVAIDYGHEQMYAVEPASMLYMAKVAGVPIANFHLNNAKTHSNDEDRIAGTGDIWRFIDFCYAAIDTGYDGWFGEDQFTYRTEPVSAIRLSKEFFANAMKKALLIYKEKDMLDEARAEGDQAKILDIVKEIVYTG